MVHQLNVPNEQQMPVGMHHIPGTGRKFFWTGKIAIGIRHEQPVNQLTTGEQLIQSLMLRQTLRG